MQDAESVKLTRCSRKRRRQVMYHESVKRATILIFALVIILAGCYSGTRPPRIGETAPDFSVNGDPRAVALHDLRGQVVVLNFWATWCPPCVEEMPSLVTLQSHLKDKGGPRGDLLAVDDALTRLAAHDPRKSQVVELRFFGGLSVEETAEALRISPETVMRDWKMAKAWLYRELGGKNIG